MAPPGYVGVTPTPMGMANLKRTAGVERAALTAIVAVAVLAVVGAVVGRTVVDDADAFLAGTTDQDQFIEAIAPYLLLSFVEGLAILASAILVMVWMYRIAKNHALLHRGATWGPGWAIGGWLLPPVLYIIPFLMFRELWKASDPDVPIGGEWRTGRVPSIVPIWFVLYGIVPIVLFAFQTTDVLSAFAASETEMAEQITGGQGPAVAGVVATVAAAAAFVVMARGLGRRHRRLTGEDLA